MAILKAVIAGVALAAMPAVAQDYDFDWAVIGDVGNPVYDGPDPFNFVTGRGSVDYKYRISTREVTTGQWLEFVNTFSTQSDDLKYFGMPMVWGAELDFDYNGPGWRWKLQEGPNSGMRPVGGITWYDAARFVNWLHNEKSSDLSAFVDGAYDTSTFGYDDNGNLTDQAVHHPDAKFWIPTLDEWIKAAHYDPDRYGPGAGGWWTYSTASDDAPIPGPPGEGEANTGFELPDYEEWLIPLGAYQAVRSPWGLYDTAGATAEWLEDFVHPEDPEERFLDGTRAGVLNPDLDAIQFLQSWTPDSPSAYSGLRVASLVPEPGIGVVLTLAGMFSSERRRKEALS